MEPSGDEGGQVCSAQGEGKAASDPPQRDVPGQRNPATRQPGKRRGRDSPENLLPRFPNPFCGPKTSSSLHARKETSPRGQQRVTDGADAQLDVESDRRVAQPGPLSSGEAGQRCDPLPPQRESISPYLTPFSPSPPNKPFGLSIRRERVWLLTSVS